ncbi:MAG TPA: 5-formyltetrahydrofolate cyclo-ligase [Anaeromyxobacter sp.]
MHEQKRPLRSELIAARARLTSDERAARSALVAERIAKVPGFADAKVLALYAPIGTELDVTEIARRALAGGIRLAYPRVVRGARRLAYAQCEPGRLVSGELGTHEPPPGAPEILLADIECAIVPGLGFSTDGHRLGRGGGHYDATLAAMPRALRVGVAFDVQVVPELPREPHDEPLDAVVTDLRVLLFPRHGPGGPRA